MAIYNGGGQLSQNVGGRLYDLVGFHTLILISAGCTALCWFLLPLVRVEDVEARGGSRQQALRRRRAPDMLVTDDAQFIAICSA